MTATRVVVAAPLLALAAASPAGATTPVTSAHAAYWWQPEPVTGLIPAPGVPAGGLYVASSPSGTQAESALRITTATESGVVRVTLQVAQREVVNPPAITAFPATSQWQPGGPQPWSSRPRYAASAALGDGTYNPTQTHMSLLVPAAALASGIVLLPAATPGASIGPTFAISFYPPLESAVTSPPSPTTRASHSTRPTSSTSASPSHRAGSSSPTPTHSRHSAKPTHRPRHSASPAGAPPTPAPSTAAPVATAPEQAADHDGRTAAIVIGVVLVVSGATAMAWRRRRQDHAPG